MKLIDLFEIEPQEHTPSVINNTHGWGRVPNNQNVDYLGMRVLMKPSDFLKLAAPLERADAHSLKDMVAHLRSGGTVASPWLVISIPDAWEDSDYGPAARVVSHEGRNRMYAIQEVQGDVPVQVHMFFASGLRARHIQPDWVHHMRSHLIPQGAKTAQAGDWFTPITQAVDETQMEAEPHSDVHGLSTDQLEKLMKANTSYSFNIPRRKLKIANLLGKGVIFVTYPHDESGWDADDNQDWSYSLITLYNMHQGGWTAEANKYKKPLSYAHAAHTINTSQPNLGDQKLVYDNKYLQILWSVKKLGLPDQLVYENPSAEPPMQEAWSKKYKKSINCDNPKGFSQRAHCAGRKARQAHKSTQSKSVSENNVTPSRNNISQQLRQWEEMDQKPRNEYQKFVQTKFGGNYNNARSTWMAQKGTSEEDFFGTAEKEKQVHNQLLTMLPQIPFDTLTKEDWDNLWLITQHADQLPELQKRVLNKLKQYVHVGDNRSHSEYLTDRLLKNQGKPQKYFTQMSEGTQALTAFQQSRCNHKR